MDSWDVHVARVGEGVGLLIRPRFRILLMIACIVQKIKPSALSTCFRGITETILGQMIEVDQWPYATQIRWLEGPVLCTYSLLKL